MSALTPFVLTPFVCSCAKTVPVAPVYQFDKLPATASPGDKVLALLRGLVRGRKYEGEQGAVIEGMG